MNSGPPALLHGFVEKALPSKRSGPCTRRMLKAGDVFAGRISSRHVGCSTFEEVKLCFVFSKDVKVEHCIRSYH